MREGRYREKVPVFFDVERGDVHRRGSMKKWSGGGKPSEMKVGGEENTKPSIIKIMVDIKCLRVLFDL